MADNLDEMHLGCTRVMGALQSERDAARKEIAELRAYTETLRNALTLTLAALRALRRLAWTGSRISPDRYQEKAQADAADEAARKALAGEIDS